MTGGTVGFYGDLDLDLHCEQDVRVTLTNVAVVPGLAFDIMFSIGCKRGMRSF